MAFSGLFLPAILGRQLCMACVFYLWWFNLDLCALLLAQQIVVPRSCLIDLWLLVIVTIMDCLVGTDYGTASVRKCPRTYLGITICLPFYFYSIPKVLDSCTVQQSSVADGSASEVLQTSCTVQGLCTVHGDVLLSMYCTWRCSPFCVLYMATPHSHTCIKGS